MADKAVNDRIDDLIELLGPFGYRGSRIEVIRRAIFALPTDDEEHLARLMQYGGLRYREAAGLGWSEEALEVAEGQLGMYAEDADRAALVAELRDLKDRLAVCASRGEKIAEYARGGKYTFA